MIRHVRGTVSSIEENGIVLDVSGWGVFVHVTDTAPYSLDSIRTIQTYLAVKQDGFDVYGFSDAAERRFFEQLLGVSGVGPKTALSILRKGPRTALEGAISARDLDYLTRVVGLGKKVAEKLMVELSEKIITGTTPDTEDGEVFDTLVALGYTDREARTALGKIPANVVGKDARLKAALSAK